MTETATHALHTFDEVESAGPATQPLEFPPPIIGRGGCVISEVINPETKRIETRRVIQSKANPERAYLPQKFLQKAIHGEVWACLTLRRSEANFEHESLRPDVWEVVGNHVAIKIMHWKSINGTRGVHAEDPIKEVAAMQLLGDKNPHVIHCIEAFQDEDRLYIIMPFFGGGELFSVVAEKRTKQSESTIKLWFRQILNGLHYLQSKGICHRDLSLENILLANDSNDCSIIDLGMCMCVPYSNRRCPAGEVTNVTNGSIRRLVTPQGTCGKRHYIAPEVYKNKDNIDGFAIDLWSAAVILFIMLTGEYPYEIPSLEDPRFEWIVNGRLGELLHNSSISEEAVDLMQGMLRLYPRDRLSLAQIMSHPWFSDRDDGEDVPCPNRPEKTNGWLRRTCKR